MIEGVFHKPFHLVVRDTQVRRVIATSGARLASVKVLDRAVAKAKGHDSLAAQDIVSFVSVRHEPPMRKMRKMREVREDVDCRATALNEWIM